MEYQKFIPEGWKITKEETDFNSVKKAMETGQIMQGKVLRYDKNANLQVALGTNLYGIMLKEEFEIPEEFKENVYKHKENTYVQFKIKNIDNASNIYLSRKEVKTLAIKWAQEELKPGNIVCGLVKNIRPFGAFIEIGGGVVGLLHIEDISISRIKSPEERFIVGQKINVMIKSIDKDKNKIVLSYKELLGNWEENIKEFEEKTIVDGIIKETDKYKNGIFVELKPNLVGMAEYKEGFKYGQKVKVLIKKIIKSKKKIKVVIV